MQSLGYSVDEFTAGCTTRRSQSNYSTGKSHPSMDGSIHIAARWSPFFR